MQTAEITVAYVNPPKPGKKSGSVKSTDGVSYWGPPAALAQYDVGETYMIQYETNEAGFNNLVTAKSHTPKQGMDPQAPPPRTQSSSHTKSVEMATMGFLGRCYQGTGNVPSAETLEVQMRSFIVAWTRAFNDLG